MGDEIKFKRVKVSSFKIDGVELLEKKMEDPAFEEAVLKMRTRISSELDGMFLKCIMPLRGVEVVPDQCSPPTHVFKRGEPKCKCGALEA